MFIFLLGLSFFSGKFNSFKFSDLNGKEWLFIVLSGVAGALSWLFYFYALQNGKTTSVVALDRLSIVFTAIFAYFLLSEKLSIQEIIGVILMTIGGIVISLRV
jgi:transporter family protein